MDGQPGDKQTVDVVKLMKVISDALKLYIESISDPAQMPHNDATLIAMDTLSLMCSLCRGYTKEEIVSIFTVSQDLANKLFDIRKAGVDVSTANMTPDSSSPYRN